MPVTLPPDAPQFTELANVVVLSGHGMLIQEAPLATHPDFAPTLPAIPFELTFALPQGCSVTLWCHTQVFADEQNPGFRSRHRFLLGDEVGVMVEQAEFDQARAAVAANAYQGRHLPLTFAPGEVVPNLMLLPPRLNQLGIPPGGAMIHRTFGGPSTLARCIRRLHGPGTTTHFHWAACSELVVHRDIGQQAWPEAPRDIFDIALQAYQRRPGPALPHLAVPPLQPLPPTQ